MLNQGRLISIPVHLYKELGKVYRARQEFLKANGTDPSTEELHTCSSPRLYFNDALMRCPSGDQPRAGRKVRGITGPGSSVQMVVGSVEGWGVGDGRNSDCGRNLCHWSSNCGCFEQWLKS